MRGVKVSDRRNVLAFSRASIRAGEAGNPFLRATNTDAVHQDIATGRSDAGESGIVRRFF